ncbi:hypothetical protein FB45DRAFT_753072 [Roridomyces roridus]|uniref:C2H2-type domain-containing protein n=1 Tax=Roridomyces roridus TaxID=1738132 RepID=A0AAD7BJK5_9AGAR|nr:hypothetical protein FB45DRAFT_753072 [Roridomyces roridus]
MGPLSAPHSQNRFYTQPRSYGALPKLYTSNILDQRRMSEPHLPQIAGANRAHQYNYDYNNNYEVETSRSPDSPFLPRVASLDSLRRQEWKQEPEDPRPLGDVSPFQPSFSSISGSPQYVLRSEENTYGPSPPGTATSSSSTATPAAAAQDSPEMGNKKTYSFVALPGNTVRKRPRRRYDEIERLYHCSWPECTKSYGTLNHLNAHVQMQKHGPKRSPNEFKELRKQWRKAKKEYESPSLGPIRRSMSLRSDDLYHGHPYNAPHRSFSHNTALSPPLSVSIPHGSYGVDQHLRYPPDTSGEIDPQQPYGGMEFRQPSAPTGWTPSTSRGEIYQSPLTAQPTYPYLDNSHPQMMESASSVNSSYNTSPARSTLGRLPPGSMLLTPLVQSADSYPEPYYDDEARDGQRLDSGSGDEY